MSDLNLEAALALLLHSDSRQRIDQALAVLISEAVLTSLNTNHRAMLRQAFARYQALPPAKDKAALIREKLVRLLVHIAHPDDEDVFCAACQLYYLQPVTDVAQNARAAGLAGLAAIHSPLALMYATQFLGEEHTSMFNGEPALTAVQVLAAAGQSLPIYQFLLLGSLSRVAIYGEVIASAFEALPADFPADRLAAAARPYITAGAAVALTGYIAVCARRPEAILHDDIEAVIAHSEDADLRRYALLMLATSRNPALIERLHRLARLAPLPHLPAYLEAVAAAPHPDRDALLAQLQRRG